MNYLSRKEDLFKHYCDSRDQIKKSREYMKKQSHEMDIFKHKMSDIIKENKVLQRMMKQVKSEVSFGVCSKRFIVTPEFLFSSCVFVF